MLWRLGGALAARVVKDDIGAFAAALTYNLLFALFPLALALAALVPALHLAAAQRALLAPLSAVVDPEVVSLIGHTAAHGGHVPSPSLACVGVGGYLWGMSAAFRRLMDAFNHAYGCPLPLRRSPWETVVLSVVLALTLGVGLVAAMVVAVVGQDLTRAVLPALAWWAGGPVAAALRWLTLLALAVVMLAVLYGVAPDRPRVFHWFSPGAVAAIAIWMAISLGFSRYLSHFNSYNLVYGSVGAVILLLLYLYFLSYALLIGGELNALLQQRRPVESST